MGETGRLEVMIARCSDFGLNHFRKFSTIVHCQLMLFPGKTLFVNVILGGNTQKSYYLDRVPKGSAKSPK